jgi:RNA polymerase sigma-70 factor (ECF subfamily)
VDEHSFNAAEPDPAEREEKIRTGKAVEQLYSCINKLKEIDRLIISMVLDELSYKEIAEVTGMTVTNIGVKITRIKKELAAMMEPLSID